MNQSDEQEKLEFSRLESPGLQSQQPKASLVFSVRFRPEDLATLAGYFLADGENLAGGGQTLRLAGETLAEIIRRKNPSLTFTAAKASKMLLELGIVSGQTSRNTKRLFRAIQLETLLEERKANAPPQERETLELYRQACRTLLEMGETPSPEQLQLAQAKIENGQLKID